MTFIIGQRWISNNESQLGLGLITAINGRHICISFPAAEEERIYAADSAPLSRILYKEGDDIVTVDKRKLTVSAIKENQGLMIYEGIDESGNILEITEPALDCFIQLATPSQRLFSGQLDKLNAFKLRIDTLNHLSRLQQSKARGLLGSRTSHLPHQVYIAGEIAKRYAPRVLLADEVGLGKTIEAGMIIHYQLHTGRASRVLIVVPSTLIHQWLVEMLRRFNLHFSIFDQDRYERSYDCQSDNNDDEYSMDCNNENMFESEQLVLCSLDFLVDNPDAFYHATTTTWDLLVVDEAHHLHWSETLQSPQYNCIEQLSEQSKGLLLLTATPEQIGLESHFARLRLLDPSRFYDFAAFKQEEENYKPLNQLVQKLIEYQEKELTDELNSELKTQIADFFPGIASSNINTVINELLDRHGTSRVLFRNTRAAIQGFPERHLIAYPLATPSIYVDLADHKGITNLYPETLVNEEEWLRQDPRVEWLSTKLQTLRPEKVLVICAKATTALALEQCLKIKKGIRSSSFHEGLSIIDRDRAAAYFSESENGAQVLICSEIGSEGRNFQFAHHLVLFDLPLNPDLLEQRIGRLDRIGQQHTIEIHVPYLLETAQEKLFYWFHEGLNLFEKSCSIGYSIYEKFAEQLLEILYSTNLVNSETFNRLISNTKSCATEMNLALNEGRNRLLELNSCNLKTSEELIAVIESEENSLVLESYMANVFHEYGIEHEYHSDYAEILRPSGHMRSSHFPGLKEDGVTITYSRNKALVREDMAFLSWEHPMVTEAMEMILDSEIGNNTLATISLKGIAPGTLLLETFYTINCAAPKSLQLDRFLPLTPIRLLIDLSGKNLTKILDYQQLNSICEKIKRHVAQAIIKQIRQELEKMLEQSNKFAEQQMQEILLATKIELKKSISHEINRLEALQKINPSIRIDEINFFKQQIVDSEYFINHADLKLQAIRVVVNK